MKDFWSRSYTPVRFPGAPFALSPRDRFLFLGSCFAEELARRCEELELPSSPSPFGPVYNPLSLDDSLQCLLQNRLKGEPFRQSGLWRHFSFHSKKGLPGEDADFDGARRHFSSMIERGHGEILDADYLVITLGTAWVFKHKKSNRVVNNCHRCGTEEFLRDNYRRIMAGREDIPLLRSLNELREKNSSVRIIITLSPVRHLRDDARENSYSKALLRCLCEDLCREREWIHYFPAYEIVMDELRDYRWYGTDLTHLSPEAVKYVLERFFSWAGGEELHFHIADRERVLKGRSHRPLYQGMSRADSR